MKLVQVGLPDKLAMELDRLIKDGWFKSQDEVMRLAIMEFIQRYEFKLIEQFQREDIRWALEQKGVQE